MKSNHANPAANTDPTADSKQLAELEQQVTELTQDLQRTRADFENYRKQIEAQKSQLAVATAEATVGKFLSLIDDFDRALTTYPDQLAPLAKSFAKTLDSLHLAKIDSSVGVEFNPDLHDAISVEDDGGETEVIAETLRPGYIYQGAVIRPAMVKVKHA